MFGSPQRCLLTSSLRPGQACKVTLGSIVQPGQTKKKARNNRNERDSLVEKHKGTNRLVVAA